MSEKWDFYPCQVGDHRASIFFDEGIAQEIDRLALPNALKVALAIKDPQHGLPSNQEADRLFAIEDSIKATIETSGGVYLGRITMAGVRFFLALMPEEDDGISARLSDIAAADGYEIDCTVEADPDKDIYWQDLWPTPDDRQVMEDLKVLGTLQKHGDLHALERPVNHWSYFHDRGSADAYAQWLADNGYADVTVEDLREEPESSPVERPMCVRCIHHGSMHLDDITGHTVALLRKTRDLGGEYDGWETSIMRSPG